MFGSNVEDCRPEISISIDLELDGTSIIFNSCLQLGVVAFYHHAGDVNPYILDSWVVSRREWSTYPQEGKQANPEALAFLEREQPDLLPYIKENAIDIRQCIGEFCEWYSDLMQRYKIAVFVASPASIDYAWLTNLVAAYRPSWAHSITFPNDCRCLKTMMNVATNTCQIDTWSEHSLLHQHPFQQKHFALIDAIKQAYMYLKLRVLLRRHRDLVRSTFAPPRFVNPYSITVSAVPPAPLAKLFLSSFPMTVIEEFVEEERIAEVGGDESVSESSSVL